ncbi:MAG: MiaB/RimO family radical SAM methylthiotransferase, partial [Actinomycetota bacterium]
YQPADNIESADIVIINSCAVRDSAENRVYGLVKNLKILKKKKSNLEVIVTGCVPGASSREKSGRQKKKLTKGLRDFARPVDASQFDFEIKPKRGNPKIISIPISNGCNNFCSYCVVPLARGPEVSRSMKEIIDEAKIAIKNGGEEIMLIGQNVNSYGADLIKDAKKYKLPSGREIKPVIVKHLGKYRLPTLFPYLLEEICKIKGVKKVSFMSSNPWDFSDELINVIAKYPQINREIHIPLQSGDDEVLKRMNRWYTRDGYLKLIKKIRNKILGVSFTTDIIVGFPGETKAQFEKTVDLAKKINFNIAHIACYSPRLGTMSEKNFKNDVPILEKKRRLHILDEIINKKL